MFVSFKHLFSHVIRVLEDFYGRTLPSTYTDISINFYLIKSIHSLTDVNLFTSPFLNKIAV